MSDTSDRPGSPADRSVFKQIGDMSTLSGAVGLLVSTGDYLGRCATAHTWLIPDNALMTIWATAAAPLILLVYRIVENRLKKAAEE